MVAWGRQEIPHTREGMPKCIGGVRVQSRTCVKLVKLEVAKGSIDFSRVGMRSHHATFQITSEHLVSSW
jgi:hypothetical protein